MSDPFLQDLLVSHQHQQPPPEHETESSRVHSAQKLTTSTSSGLTSGRKIAPSPSKATSEQEKVFVPSSSSSLSSRHSVSSKKSTKSSSSLQHKRHLKGPSSPAPIPLLIQIPSSTQSSSCDSNSQNSERKTLDLSLLTLSETPEEGEKDQEKDGEREEEVEGSGVSTKKDGEHTATASATNEQKQKALALLRGQSEQAVNLTEDQKTYMRNLARRLDQLEKQEKGLERLYEDVTELQNTICTRRHLEEVISHLKRVREERQSVAAKFDDLKCFLLQIKHYEQERIKKLYDLLEEHNRQSQVLDMTPELKNFFERELSRDFVDCNRSLRKLVPAATTS